MNKNVGVMIQETQINVAKALNESGLPPSILQLVVKDIYGQVSAMALQELNQSANQSTKEEGEEGEVVDLGEGIETPTPEEYDWDNNYRPRGCE